MTNTLWPSLYEYSMAHPCPSCVAGIGVECKAPNKRKQQGRIEQLAAEREFTVVPEPLHRLHRGRQELGMAHYRRDVGNAPWFEDRVPGRRYDTLGGVW